MAGAGPGRAPRPPAACPGAVPRPRRHYRVEVEHGAHQDQQEGDGEDGEVQHGRAGTGAGAGARPGPHHGAGRGGPGRAGLRQGERWGVPGACCWSPTPPCTEGGTWATASSTSRASSGGKRRGGDPRRGGRALGGSSKPVPSSRRKVKRVLFVPYALHDRDAYARTAREKFESLGKGGPRGDGDGDRGALASPASAPVSEGARAAGSELLANFHLEVGISEASGRKRLANTCNHFREEACTPGCKAAYFYPP